MAQITPQISIIVPTYNESQNIIGILKQIHDNIPKSIRTQTIVIDDNSPDGTVKIVEDYIANIKKIAENTIDITHRKAKDGLSSAILKGIQNAKGETIVVMDSDFSHPPQIIPKIIEAFKEVKELGILTHMGQEKLVSVKSCLIEHFNKEDEKFYPVLYKAAEQNKKLKYELVEEIEGIFNWAIEGLIRLLARGYFEIPEESIKLIQEYKEANNHVITFTNEWCKGGELKSISKNELYREYGFWCKESGYKQL